MTRGDALLWDESFNGLMARLAPYLAAGFLLSEQPIQVMGNVWFAPLSWPASSDARDFPLHLVDPMALSNEWMMWHLTPAGWRQGDGQLDSGPVSHGTVPDDRVLTFRYREVVKRPFSGITESLREIWRAPDDVLIQQLLAEHGPCPAAI